MLSYQAWRIKFQLKQWEVFPIEVLMLNKKLPRGCVRSIVTTEPGITGFTISWGRECHYFFSIPLDRLSFGEPAGYLQWLVSEPRFSRWQAQRSITELFLYSSIWWRHSIYLNFLTCILCFMTSSIPVRSLFSFTTLESASMSSMAQ